jgi:hypothetical membrane protein
MPDHRLRWGALAWLLTLQFFVVETVAQLRYGAPYSRVDDVISDLGAGSSPAAALMNASFVLQGVLIAVGALLLRPALRREGGRLATVLLVAAGAGVLVVGVVPLDADGQVHAAGAVAYLLGGSTGLLALAHAVRPRSELLGSGLALLGVVATAMSVFFLAGITRYLGEGGTERAAAYLLPVGLALTGVALWRLRSPAAAEVVEDEVTDDGPSGRELRARERAAARAEAARQAAERDAALERYAAADDLADDQEDHWAPSARRED